MKRIVFATTLTVVLCGGVYADEGLWLFDEPPREALKKNYAFDLSDACLEHLQKSALRLDSGSGAFVSADGLILTNHHVVSTWLDLLTTKDRDVYEDGYCAHKREQELPCPGLSVEAVWKMADVTERVLGAIKPEMSLAQSRAARKAVTAAIAHEFRRKTGLFAEVVPLYHGERYHVYGYRKYADVRLVFAPEEEVSQLFDVCVLRAYEHGKPARINHYLRWAAEAPKTHDLVLAAVFPGSTSRLLTVPHMESLYGSSYFLSFKAQARSEAVVSAYYQRNRDQEQQIRLEYADSAEDFEKSLAFLGGLERTLARRRDEEKRFRAALAAHPLQHGPYRDAESRIAAFIKERERLYPRYLFLASAAAFDSELFDLAREIVRMADERTKPDRERLVEYRNASLPALKAALLVDKAVVKELETAKLADSLSFCAQWLGGDDAEVKMILAGKNPEERARELVAGTRLDRVEVRKALVKEGWKGVAASHDSMIALARLVDAPARKIEEEYEEKVAEAALRAYPAVAQAQRRLRGTAGYPDATISLRLSFGRVLAPSKRRNSLETLADVYRYLESSNQESSLPARWRAARSVLAESTPLALIHDADVVGGNSGSPMVNRAGQFVGVATYVKEYTDLLYAPARAVNGAMSAQGILAILAKVYEAHELVKELAGGSTAAAVVSGPAPGVPPPPPWPVSQTPVSAIPPPPPSQRHKQLIVALIAALEDPDRDVVSGASAALGRIGGDAVPDVLKLLKAMEPRLRAAAAQALGKMAYQAETAIPALLTAVTDKDIDVRRQAVNALAEIVYPPYDEVLPPLPTVPIPATVPPPPSTPPSAAFSGGEVVSQASPSSPAVKLTQRYKGLVPGLLTALKDSDNEISQGAARALGRVGRDAIPPLVALLKANQAKSRAAAALALGKMRRLGQSAMPALMAALTDEDREVRRQAVRALTEILPDPNGPPVPLSVPN